MRRLLLALAVLGAVLLPGSPAWAHNSLAAAVPVADATLRAAPATVSLRFLQRLNPDFTTIVVSDAAGKPVATSTPAVAGATGTVTFAGKPANGRYTVAYRVVSVDGHAVKGSYVFTVADPALVTTAVALSTPAPPERGGSGVLIGLGILLVVATAGLLLLRARRRRPSA
ncbi:copper resistance CopC family protein [Micromonosporaceae bacterium Da 78-11]